MKATARIMLAALFLAAGFAGPVGAQEQGGDFEGVPAYSVARLKVFEGSVWVRPPGSGEWEEFVHNSPVPEDSRVAVPEGSEAELQFHGGQFMLLTGGSEVDIRQMDTEATVFGLRSGEIRFDLPEADFAPVRVEVPQDARVSFPSPGKYWLTAGEGGESTLVVRAGEGTVVARSGEATVRAGEEARIGSEVRLGRYEEGPVEYEERPPLTEEEKAAGVPPAAAYELRDYGEWVYTPQYGHVWRPRVGDEWAPYYYGRWEWIPPYGWVWIAREPWGWYPYHYGWWHSDPSFGWVWSPFHSFVSVSFFFGHDHFHHFHRHAHFFPAKVRFVRDGRHVRWVPLRPGERARRVPFTRADKRLTRWEGRLREGTVFVRGEGRGGREWRDWTEVRAERRGVRGSRAEVRREGPSDRARGTEVRREGREQVREVRPETRGRAAEVRPDRGEQVREARPDARGERTQARPEREERQRGDEAVRGRPGRSGGREISPRRGGAGDRPGRSPGRRMDLRTAPGVRSGSFERGRERSEPSGSSRRERYEVRDRSGRSFRTDSGRRGGPARSAPRNMGRGGRDTAPPAQRFRSGGSGEQRFRGGGAPAPRFRSGGSSGPRIQGSSGGSRFRGGTGGSRIRSGGSGGFRFRSGGGGSRSGFGRGGGFRSGGGRGRGR